MTSKPVVLQVPITELPMKIPNYKTVNTLLAIGKKRQTGTHLMIRKLSIKTQVICICSQNITFGTPVFNIKHAWTQTI